MTKTRFIQLLSAKAAVEPRQTEALLNAMSELVRETVAAGNEIRIPGIGKIFPALRKARQVLSPTTREPLQIPESYHVRFKAASTLKAASNR